MNIIVQFVSICKIIGWSAAQARHAEAARPLGLGRGAAARGAGSVRHRVVLRLPIFGKFSAKCCSFSALSAPIFASKYAFGSIFQNLPDYQADFFEIWQNLQILRLLQKFCWIFNFHKNCWIFKPIFCENFEIAAVQKYANLVKLEKCCQTHIFLQNFVLIQPRTSPLKIWNYYYFETSCQFC